MICKNLYFVAFCFGVVTTLIHFTNSRSTGIHSDVIVTKYGPEEKTETTDEDKEPGWMVSK